MPVAMRLADALDLVQCCAKRSTQAAPGAKDREAYAGAVCPAPMAIRFSAFMCAMAKVSSVICASL